MILFLGLTSSIFQMRSLAPSGISSGMMNLPLLTLARRFLMFSSSNGNLPVSSAKRMIPHDHMSDDDPW